MAHDDIILHRTRDLQRRMFRVACDPLRYGLTLKAISIDSGIPYSTLRTYADGAACMALPSIVKLCGVIPNELLSMLLPSGLAIVATDVGEHDDTAAKCIDFMTTYTAARHPESEAGVDIGPNEGKALARKGAQLRAA